MTNKKLNLNALLGGENNKDEKKENKQQVETLYTKKQESPLEKIIETELSTEIDSKKDKNNKSMNNSNNSKEEKIEFENEDKEFFSNYETDFEKKKETISEKIKKFKNFVKPKTRLGFILMIISITFLGIGSLFIINPKIHNINNYKANILQISSKIGCKINNKYCEINKNNINTKKSNTIKNKVSENKKNIELIEKTIKKENFEVNYKIKKENGKEIIIYNQKEYTKKEFNKKIINIINKLKKEKLKNYFKKKNVQ